MTFGVSVAAYNQKPNTYVQKAVAPAVAPNVMSTSAVTPNQAPASKTALSGSTAPVASGLLDNVQTPVYQPVTAANIGNRSDSIYGRLNAINSVTDSMDQLNAGRVSAANGRINSWNSRIKSGGVSGDFSTGDSGLDNEQMDNARLIAHVGNQRGMSDQGIQIAIMTAITESGLRNVNYGDRDSVGLFQQRTSQGWGSVPQIMDRVYSTNKFYDSLAGQDIKSVSPWQAAQAVQRSFDPTGSNYQKNYAQAQRAYSAIFQPNTVSGGNAAAPWINAFNNKYVDYDGQFGAQCVDLYNYYTTGFVGGKNFMVGYAPEIFNNYDTGAYTRYNANQIPGRMGDVAVFRPGSGTPSGHVAIVVGDNGNGTLRVLQANATAAGSRGNTIISNISKSTLMGYLRPNKLG